jgi:hypothetical protein
MTLMMACTRLLVEQPSSFTRTRNSFSDWLQKATANQFSKAAAVKCLRVTHFAPYVNDFFAFVELYGGYKCF